MTHPGRCVAAVRLPSGDLKRCTRYNDHAPSLHLWIESFDVIGADPLVVEWSGDADVSDAEFVGHVRF